MLANFNEYFTVIETDNLSMLNFCRQVGYRLLHINNPLADICKKFQLNSIEETGHTRHILLLYKPTKTYVGSVKIITPQLNSAMDEPLPIEKKYRSLFDNNIAIYDELPRQHLAEIVNFKLLTGFREKFAALGLLRAISEMCYKNNIYYLYQTLDTHTNNLLATLGIKFEAITPTLTCPEEMRCYLGCLHEIVQRLHHENPKTWEFLTDQGRLTFTSTPNDNADMSGILPYYTW